LNLDFTQSRIVIDIKPKYTKKDSRPRKVYVSREAERHLKPYLNKISLGLNAITLRKSLNRLLTKKEIKGYSLYVDSKNRFGNNHRIFYKGYKISKF